MKDCMDKYSEAMILDIKNRVEPIKEVCELTLCHITNNGTKYYESDCGLDYEILDSKSKFCRGCGKPIKIKVE